MHRRRPHKLQDGITARPPSSLHFSHPRLHPPAHSHPHRYLPFRHLSSRPSTTIVTLSKPITDKTNQTPPPVRHPTSKQYRSPGAPRGRLFTHPSAASTSGWHGITVHRCPWRCQKYKCGPGLLSRLCTVLVSTLR
ncbi:hypothetical protein B0H10DRAFT_407820 [Mycena sp. CBHHK59/15]|nr:hypothetical protein B0H10DRAFT_407820 [Mycena sp. CBHHK59/15]